MGPCRSSSQTASANGKPKRIAKGNNATATVMSNQRLLLSLIRGPSPVGGGAPCLDWVMLDATSMGVAFSCLPRFGTAIADKNRLLDACHGCVPDGAVRSRMEQYTT